MTAVAVAIGGAVGAVLRWALARLAASGRWPWGTFVANVAGSLLLGLVAPSLTGAWLALLGTGVAGALTTYSSFALESVLLDRNGRRHTALLNVALTLTAGGLAFALGWWLGS